MADFLKHSTQFQRIHFFHLGGNHHGNDSNDVKPGRIERLDLFLKISVHDLDAREERLLSELV